MYKEKQKNMGAEQYEEDIKVQRLIPVLHKVHVFHNSIINSSFEGKDMQQIQRKIFQSPEVKPIRELTWQL